MRRICPTCNRPINSPRSVGPGSQNHHINGHIAQLARETGMDFDTIKQHCKRAAIARGYPFDTYRDDVIPWSESRIDTVQSGYLIDQIHQEADELNITLQE